jgi:hypothetical protein
LHHRRATRRGRCTATVLDRPLGPPVIRAGSFVVLAERRSLEVRCVLLLKLLRLKEKLH